MKTRLKNLWNWIIISEIRVALLAFLLTSTTLFILTVNFDPSISVSKSLNLGLYNKPDFWGNVIVESHGMLLDILVIGVFIFWLQKRTQAKREKQLLLDRYKDELDDCREWVETEAAYKVAGIIKRLEAVGDLDFNLTDLHLGKAPVKYVEKALMDKKIKIASLEGANLSKLNLEYANFENVIMNNANLSKSKLNKSNFCKTLLNKAILSRAELHNADFTESDLIGAEIRDAKLENANFVYANLTGTNFSYSNLKNVDFSEAILKEVDFSKADLESAILRKADLRDANLSDVMLESVKLKGAKLEGARVALDWFERLHEWNVDIANTISRDYELKEVTGRSIGGATVYLLKKK